jgi:serine palmitoyltransferase
MFFELHNCTTWVLTRSAPQEAAAKAIDHYGIGACGPRAFYGSMDVHLVLEERLAHFMGAEEAILYSYDVATLPSVLPAFASRKDIIVIDELCPWPHHNGAALSRAKGMFLP